MASARPAGAQARRAGRSPTPSREVSGYDGDALGLQPLAAVDHVDPHPLAGAEQIDPGTPERGDMDENVLAAAIGRNKPVALFGLEPFDRALERRRRPRRSAVKPVAPAIAPRVAPGIAPGIAARRRRGAAVDIQHQGDERPLGAG